MERLSAIVPAAIARDEVVRAARAMRVLKRWPEVVGEVMATKSAPDRYDHGTVWVAVTSSEWSQNLRMAKSQILDKLALLSGEPELFKDVRFGVRALPPVVKPEPQDTRAEEHRKEIEGLTIPEIRARRMRIWNSQS